MSTQLLERFGRGESRKRQGGAEGWILLSMSLSQFPQCLSHIRVFLFPQLATRNG
ncbi:MAG: hypothetical protein WBG92_19510 [Thiohalocapsa sp.]